MGNWKNRHKSHGVPLSTIWPGWERLAKEKSHKKKHKTMWEKNNQPLSMGSPNSIESFSTETHQKNIINLNTFVDMIKQLFFK
jgi:NADPH-dependent glutamate synthase beta subunit-like oxidoreductase